MIDLNRWREIKEIVQVALDLSPEERPAYTADACRGDEVLQREVEALLSVSATRADALDALRVVAPTFHQIHLEEGDEVGPYRILRILGQGGMGLVYLAHDTANDRDVALKVLPSGSYRPSRDREEHRILARLTHPNIAALYASGKTDDGLSYFAMEYVEGEPITIFCNIQRLGIKERLLLFAKVSRAVAYAHQRAVIHRDLKPENILVTPEGEPKLLDFGIAKLLTTSEIVAEMAAGTRDNRALSLPFASPEQLSNDADSTTTDVYSLGVLLCLLLTGRLPYTAKSDSELYWAIRNVEPTRPSQLAKGATSQDTASPDDPPFIRTIPNLARYLRGDLDAIVIQALAKTPEERYPTVKELSDDIVNYLGHRPVAARRGNWTYSVGKFLRRHHIGASFTALSLLGAIAFSAALGHQYHLTLRERDVARAAATRSEQLSIFLVSMFDIGDPFRHLTAPPTLKELLAQAVRQLRSGRFNMPEDKAVLFETLGRIYSAQGDFEMSLSLYQEALNATPPTEVARKARIITQIADTRIDLGQLPEARRDLDRAQSLREAAPSTFVIDLARWLITSARERAISGGFHEAIDLYDKALSLTANLPDAQVIVASIYQERSLPLLFVGRSNDALDSSNKAVGIGQRLYYKEHPALASMVMTRATIFGALGRYQNAADDLQQAEDALKSTFGPDHPVLSDVLENRGGLAIEQQNFDQATTLFRQSFDLRNRKLGPAHMETLRAYEKLGEAIQGKGDLPTAEVMLRKALQDFEHFGYDDVYSIGDLLNNLGLLLFQRGNLAESQPLLERALRVREQMHGPKSAWVAVTKGNLSNLYSQQGQRERARRELLESIDILKASFGPQHYLVAIGLNNLGTMYKTSQDYGSAAKLYRESLAILQRADLGDSLLSAYPMLNLSEVLLEARQLQVAHELIQRAQDILRTKSDPALPLRDEADGIEGTYLLLREQFPEAEAKMKLSYEGLRQKTGPRSKQTQAALARLIRLYDSWGKPDLAASYRKLGSQMLSAK